MTGYGEASLVDSDTSYCVEIRSLNNRYFKASIKLPDKFQFMEADVEKLLRGPLSRGSVTLVLRVRGKSAAAAYEINRAALDRYLEQMQETRLPSGLSGTVDLAYMLTLPGVCDPPEIDESKREHGWGLVESLTKRALGQLVEMRGVEGNALRADLLDNCETIRALTQEIAKLAPSVIEEYHTRLQERVSHLLSVAKLDVDKETLLREVAVYADRCDISEETSRLDSHLSQFSEMCQSEGAVGRKLDFLAQEMLRETNTIGSKSNNAAIARNVVEVKGAIDRLKEQIQNVE
ncbi:MAG: YicC family protein [Planctomycetes bacterium]|nr:YicC family protein [Planctomycetota bacterium]